MNDITTINGENVIQSTEKSSDLIFYTTKEDIERMRKQHSELMRNIRHELNYFNSDRRRQLYG